MYSLPPTNCARAQLVRNLAKAVRPGNRVVKDNHVRPIHLPQPVIHFFHKAITNVLVFLIADIHPHLVPSSFIFQAIDGRASSVSKRNLRGKFFRRSSSNFWNDFRFYFSIGHCTYILLSHHRKNNHLFIRLRTKFNFERQQ